MRIKVFQLTVTERKSGTYMGKSHEFLRDLPSLVTLLFLAENRK
jgi:hypothetical protein